MRRTRIVCTIGPASRSPAMLNKLVAAGMDVARLNFSHGTHEEHAAAILAIREGEAEWGHPITIIQDLQGPKIRLGNFLGGRAMLLPGEPFVLTAEPLLGTAARASLDHPKLFAVLKPGDQIWMDDGAIQLVVERVGVREAHCRSRPAGWCRTARRDAPRAAGSCLTAKTGGLPLWHRAGVDYVAVSFVRRPPTSGGAFS
jgi:pyruvate kinase